jgi:hypothetical protein
MNWKDAIATIGFSPVCRPGSGVDLPRHRSYETVPVSCLNSSKIVQRSIEVINVFVIQSLDQLHY